jgi:hypothetical protein
MCQASYSPTLLPPIRPRSLKRASAILAMSRPDISARTALAKSVRRAGQAVEGAKCPQKNLQNIIPPVRLDSDHINCQRACSANHRLPRFLTPTALFHRKYSGIDKNCRSRSIANAAAIFYGVGALCRFLACQLWANSGSHAICANIAQRISADCGWVSRLLAVCFAHLGDIAACFNKTRARLIEVISQHKIEVGVTHRNGHCCPIDVS